MQSAQPTRKEGWENSDFPIVCESCLGPNPYVRMMKVPFDKECKICARPFTVFRWKPGSDMRYKKTEVCQTCAKMKNVCQTCLLDLEYGIPVQVRDAAIPGQSAPVSDVSREYLADQAERELAQGKGHEQRMELRQKLINVARTAPYYVRNRAHLCSFFVKGECKRGSECPYRHELPEEDKDPELAKQNIKDRYYGNNDPVAKKMLAKMNERSLLTPTDTTIKTLYVGNVDASLTEQDLRDHFYAYGELSTVKLVPASRCAFVSYTSRQSAEAAADQLHNNLSIKGHTLRIAWGKGQAHDSGATTYYGAQPTGVTNYFGLPVQGGAAAPLPPPPGPGKKIVYASMNPNRIGAQRDR